MSGGRRHLRDVSSVPDDDAPPEKGLKFPHWDKDGPVRDHVENTQALVGYHGVHIWYNLMTHDLEVDVPGRKLASERRANGTVDWVENRAAEAGLSRAPIIKHLRELAVEYNPALEWVSSKPWDGKCRLGELYASIQLRNPVRDGELAAKLLRHWFRGAAASLLPEFEHKFMAQGVLVAQGPQGRGKTRWLQSLVHNPDWVLTGVTIDPGNRDSTQRATSVWLCELGEVDATFRKADIAALKSFVTRPDDVYRSAYDRRAERVLRRTVYFASVNDEQYLVDRTGNRRWWTVSIERCNPDHGIDVQQLWAQFVAEVRAGEKWWLSEDELELLNQSNRWHEQEDVLTSLLQRHYEVYGHDDQVPADDWRTLADVCSGLPQFEARLPSTLEQYRVGQALRELGVVKRRDKFGYRYALAVAARQ